jgi:hypothetical protein
VLQKHTAGRRWTRKISRTTTGECILHRLHDMYGNLGVDGAARAFAAAQRHEQQPSQM